MNELRLGRYQDVLADVEVDHVISDPPYSARTHSAHDGTKGNDGAVRESLSYGAWTDDDVCTIVHRRGGGPCYARAGYTPTCAHAYRARAARAIR